MLITLLAGGIVEELGMERTVKKRSVKSKKGRDSTSQAA